MGIMRGQGFGGGSSRGGIVDRSRLERRSNPRRSRGPSGKLSFEKCARRGAWHLVGMMGCRGRSTNPTNWASEDY
jgi:hypothetical protein